jgi:hypothetical protein
MGRWNKVPESEITHKTFKKLEVLDSNEIFWASSVSILTLKIDDFVHEFPWDDFLLNDDDSAVSLIDIEKKYADKLSSCKIAALNNMTPLHDETYCYSKDDKHWYLIAEGKGYA